MMEEEALLVNIATILAKDFILDNKVKTKRPSYPSYPFQLGLEDDDDGLDLLVYEMQQKGECPFSEAEKIISISDSSEDLPKEIAKEDKYSNPKGRRQDIKLKLGEHFSLSEFENNLHLSKRTFHKLMRRLTPLIDLRMRDINGVTVSEESFVSLGLWKLATDEHFEEISRRFKVPLDVCHWTVNNFCNLLSSNLKCFIKWPTTRESQSDTLEKFQNTPGPTLANLFGIIALRQVDIFLESQDEEASVILQIICNPDQLLMDCYVELAANYSFENTPFAKRMLSEKGLMPTESYLVGDCSLPLKSYLIRPFRHPANDKEKKFNELLENKKTIINLVLNKMVKRFHSLYALEAKNLKEVKNILEAICTLHNLYQISKDDFVGEIKDFDVRIFPRHQSDENDEEGRKRRIKLMESLNL